jgi:hypothetical protein
MEQAEQEMSTTHLRFLNLIIFKKKNSLNYIFSFNSCFLPIHYILFIFILILNLYCSVLVGKICTNTMLKMIEI